MQKVFKPRESIHAHAPHYGAGFTMLEDYYSRLEYAFVPELAITSCPSAESIRKFIPEDEVWPPGPGWGYHWADLDILRIHNYEVFGDQCTDGLDRFVDATQIAQGVYFQYAGEHFRRMKPKNSGVSFCHLMLHTPDMKWAIVDFYLKPKKSFEYVQSHLPTAVGFAAVRQTPVESRRDASGRTLDRQRSVQAVFRLYRGGPLSG